MKKWIWLAVFLAACGEDPLVPTTITITPEESTLVSLGETVVLAALVEDQYDNPMTEETVTWASSDEAVATVSNGTVTAVFNGDATITASVGTLESTAMVTVDQVAAIVTVMPEEVRLEAPGEEVQLALLVRDAGGTLIEDPDVTWSIANEYVATISNEGLVTAVREGGTLAHAAVDSAAGMSIVVVDLQRGALMALYEATDGDNWRNSVNWGTEAPVSTWHGVQAAGGKVRILNLRNNNLSGTIPAELGWLDQMWRLLLGRNSLSGSIPPEIFGPRLQDLELASNDLTGPIPEEIGRSTELEHVLLQGNELTGGIPETFGNLDSLVHVRLNSNMLTGEVPAAFGRTVASWTELHDNRLEGPLPREFIGREMFRFVWGNQNGLCSPADDEFQDWMETITIHIPGPVCSG